MREESARATKIDDAQRVEILAEWVAAEQLRRSAKNSDEFERLWIDAMRADELSVLRNIIMDGKNRTELVANCLRQNPTSAFLNVVAKMMESGAFANTWRPSKKLSEQQIEYATARMDILGLLRETYAGELVSGRLLERRASDVARYLMGLTKDEANKAKLEYDDNFTESAYVRWLIATDKILARGN